jgi:hypothetical protein
VTGERRFVGLSYAEALARDLPPIQVLVDGLIEAGTVGTVAGLPETHKSFLAVAIASKVAAGSGSILGREVVGGGPVGYWWQDDSEANELARIKDYASRHGYANEPVRWYLNEALRLPDDIADLRAEVEREQQKLVVLDSLYNFIPGVGMKDEEAAGVIAQIKSKLCDPTGAAVLIVDHAPWPSDANRGQRRAYGSVFKAAAIRWGIYLDRDGDNLHVAASGNNLPGLARTQAFFDSETLELRLVEQEAPQKVAPARAARNYQAEVEALLTDGEWRTSREIAQRDMGGIGAERSKVETILDALLATGAVERFLGPPGRPNDAICYRGAVSTVRPPETTPSDGGRPSSEGDESGSGRDGWSGGGPRRGPAETTLPTVPDEPVSENVETTPLDGLK